MKKMPTIFVRDMSKQPALVIDEMSPGCEWISSPDAIATRKHDGTCCLVRDGRLYRRYEVKKGKKPPEGFEPSQPPDENTGKQPGWLPVTDAKQDRWHIEAADNALADGWMVPDGTYELVGPKVQGNPERYDTHRFLLHGCEQLRDVPTDFEGLRDWLSRHDVEGIVWHHHDGRMAKIKKKDFGLKR